MQNFVALIVLTVFDHKAADNIRFAAKVRLNPRKCAVDVVLYKHFTIIVPAGDCVTLMIWFALKLVSANPAQFFGMTLIHVIPDFLVRIKGIARVVPFVFLPDVVNPFHCMLIPQRSAGFS